MTHSQARRTARIAGVWLVVTFVASIPAVLLYDPLLNHADYVLGAGAHARIELGAFLEVVLLIANIATAVVLFPILKRQSETIALGYVATRIVESTIIAMGIVSVLALLTLQQDVGGPGAANAASLTLIGLVGGPLCFVSGIGVIFGAYDDGSAVKFLLTFPEIVWEASLGIYLIARGVRAVPGFFGDARPAVAAVPAAAAS